MYQESTMMIFVFWFQYLQAIVVKHGMTSSIFNVKTGVRQSGVCSS